MAILIRLSPALVYGDSVGLVELLGDRIGLTVRDINDIIVSYFEYLWFNGEESYSDRAIVEEYFMGDSMGYTLLYAARSNFLEINAYIPDAAKSIRYNRTLNDGFYLLCELHDPDLIDL